MIQSKHLEARIGETKHCVASQIGQKEMDLVIESQKHKLYCCSNGQPHYVAVVRLARNFADYSLETIANIANEFFEDNSVECAFGKASKVRDGFPLASEGYVCARDLDELKRLDISAGSYLAIDALGNDSERYCREAAECLYEFIDFSDRQD